MKKGKDGSVVNLRTGGNTSVNVKAEGSVTVRPKIVKTFTLPVEGAITPGQRAAFKEKVNEWVSASGLVGGDVNYPRAYKQLNRQAKSAGKYGVDRLDNYPACDFERGMLFLRKEIGKIRNTNKFIENDPEAARNNMLKEIHVNLKENKIPDSQYREYLMAEYGVNSAKLLDIGQLQCLRDYSRKGRFLIPKPKEKSVNERRTESLKRLMEARNGVRFSSIDEAQAELCKHDYGLFSDLGMDAFVTFWKGQKVTKIPRGRKKTSKEAPKA